MYEQKHHVIHYDFKPVYIMLQNDCAKILDFGLCKKMETEDTKINLTLQGVGRIGTCCPRRSGLSPKYRRRLSANLCLCEVNLMLTNEFLITIYF